MPTTGLKEITSQERSAYRPTSLDDCLDKIRGYFESYAPKRLSYRRKGYHGLLERYYKFYVPAGSRVLEIGCGTGDLLAALQPSEGVGIDLSPEMIRIARENYPSQNLKFEAEAIERWTVSERPFDYIILSDLVGFLYDIREVFKVLKPLCHERTRIVCNYHSQAWKPVLGILEALHLKFRQPVLNWVTREDIQNLFEVSGFDVISQDSRMLFPARFPLVSGFLNRICAPFWPFRAFNLTNWTVARLPKALPDDMGVSVVCPVRNEAGNIPNIVRRLPKFSSPYELIFVEGNSKDATLEACHQAVKDNPQLEISVFKQPGKGKGDAVRVGYAQAKYDILVILDGDMTVQPEDLPKFVEVLRSGTAEFVNGSRLVYPMEGQAMRFLNLLGNKFFSAAFSFLIGQKVKDTLCGTKVLIKSDWLRLVANRSFFGDFDPFGDFDLLFGSARLSLKIRDFPIRYRDRTYGETNISRFRHGFLLLKMCGVALRKLKMR